VSKHAEPTPVHYSPGLSSLFLLVGLVIVLSTNRVAGRGDGHLSHKRNFFPFFSRLRRNKKLIIETTIGALLGLRGDGKSVEGRHSIGGQSGAKYFAGRNSSITIGGMRAADISGDCRHRHSTALQENKRLMRSDCGCPTHGKQKKAVVGTENRLCYDDKRTAERGAVRSRPFDVIC